MRQTFPFSDLPGRWSLADILSSYRYWGLLGAMVLVNMGFQSFTSVLPLLLMAGDSSNYIMFGLYQLSSIFGIVIGAVIAFALLGTRSHLSLLVLITLGGVATALAIQVQNEPFGHWMMLPIGMLQGALQFTLPVAMALLLFSGAGKLVDFAGALALTVTIALVGYSAPVTVDIVASFTGDPQFAIWFLLGCMLLALALLVPTGELRYDQAPRLRHAPLAPRRRSSILLAAMLVIFSIAFLVAVIGALPMPFLPRDSLPLYYPAIAGLLALGYLGYWLYRIHGELAGDAASPHLLSPLAASLIGVLVPLGLPVLLMSLSDLLNDRITARGRGRRVSRGWLAVWSVVLPPVAIAMVQHAANRSYASLDTNADPAKGSPPA